MNRIKVISKVVAIPAKPIVYESLKFTCRGEEYWLPNPLHQFKMRSEGSIINDGLKTTDWIQYR